MKMMTPIVLVTVAVVLIATVWYTQTYEPKSTLINTPSPTINQTLTSSPSSIPTPTLTPTPFPQANVTANIIVTPIRNFDDANYLQGDYISINGTVTNNSPNTAYNVGLKVSAEAVVLAYQTTVIDVTVPVQSSIYNTGTNYALSTLNPYQTVSISINIFPDYPSEEPNLQGANVTLVWSNNKTYPDVYNLTVSNPEIEVSGKVDLSSKQAIVPSELQFTDIVSNVNYTVPIHFDIPTPYRGLIQQGTYNISLPNQHSYEVICYWDGFFGYGPAFLPDAFGTIDFGILVINSEVGIFSLTQNYSS